MVIESSVIYPNAPARLVVLAVGFPGADISQNQADALREALRPTFPIAERHHQQNVIIDPAGGSDPRHELRPIRRFSTRDRQISMAITPDSVILEARTYRNFTWYLDLVRGPLDEVAAAVQPDGVTSIGHRFVDEIHLPVGTEDFGEWFDPALLSMPSLIEEATAGWQAVVSYRLDPESQLTLRYGPIESSFVTSPDGTTQTFADPVIGLDWDSHWQPRSIPEFDSSMILEQLAAMYQPVRSLFRRVCTEKLRATFEVETTGRSQ